ncbi:MAG TPA: EamA family transporter [Pirellulales bacterium]
MSWFHWALASAVFAGATAVLAKAGTSQVEPNLATAIRTTVVLVFTWGIVAFSRGETPWNVTRSGLAFLLLSGLATAASWLCYFRALHLGEASSVAPVDKLSVVFAIIFAGLFLGEELTWRHYLGGALIVAGSLTIALKPA